MPVKSGSSRPVRRHGTRTQERGERTRALVIEETIRCIREEGFAAASTRHIIDRAGVSWGVIQYYFGDRDGLLTAVIDSAFSAVTESLTESVRDVASVQDPRERAELLIAAAWAAFSSPTCMTALEILMATRAMRGAFDTEKLSGLTSAIARVAEAIGGDSPPAMAIANLVWAAPVGKMVAQMVTTDPQRTTGEQQALAALVGDHLAARHTAAGRVSRPKAKMAAKKPPAKRARRRQE